MKVLGLDMFPKPKPDEQYIESLRRRVGKSKWFVLLHAFSFVLFMGCYFVLMRLIFWEDSPLAAMAGPGMYVGIALGAFGGLMLVFAVQSAAWAARLLHGQRTERLMLRFHDELQKRQNTVQPNAAPNSRPPSPLPTSSDVPSSDSQRTPGSGGCG